VTAGIGRQRHGRKRQFAGGDGACYHKGSDNSSSASTGLRHTVHHHTNRNRYFASDVAGIQYTLAGRSDVSGANTLAKRVRFFLRDHDE